MKEINIDEKLAGQKMMRCLERYLSNAPKSFLYKMLRKKNITLNNSKATGDEKLKCGDIIKIFFSDETFEKFSADNNRTCLLYTSPSPRDAHESRMPSSA